MGRVLKVDGVPPAWGKRIRFRVALGFGGVAMRVGVRDSRVGCIGVGLDGDIFFLLVMEMRFINEVWVCAWDWGFLGCSLGNSVFEFEGIEKHIMKYQKFELYFRTSLCVVKVLILWLCEILIN